MASSPVAMPSNFVVFVTAWPGWVGTTESLRTKPSPPGEAHTRASWEMRLEQMQSGPGGPYKPAWGLGLYFEAIKGLDAGE